MTLLKLWLLAIALSTEVCFTDVSLKHNSYVCDLMLCSCRNVLYIINYSAPTVAHIYNTVMVYPSTVHI